MRMYIYVYIYIYICAYILSLMFSLCVSSRVAGVPLGGWNNGVRHSNDVLQARANVNKYKDIYGLVTRRLHLPS